MSERCRSGLAMTGSGIYPAEAALDAAKLDAMVIAVLRPLPRRSVSPLAKAKATTAKPKSEAKAVKVRPGAKCDKGCHVCAKCLGEHSQQECH